MKKLLLTLLGAAALCGLSPHPLSAQETSTGNVLHMDFNKRADGHNDDLHFYGKLQTLTSSSSTAAATACTFHEPDTRFEWPTAAAGIKVTPEYQAGKPFTYTYANLTKNTNYSAATNYAGVKCIENDQLKLELNYMWALAKNYTQNNTYKTNFTSQIRITDTEGGGRAVFSGDRSYQSYRSYQSAPITPIALIILITPIALIILIIPIGRDPSHRCRSRPHGPRILLSGISVLR